MKTNVTIMLAALLTGACFSDVPPSSGDSDSGTGGTDDGTSSGETSGSATDSSGTTTSATDSSGTTSATSTAGSTGGVSGSTGSTGSTGGSGGIPDWLGPCETDSDCPAGVCAVTPDESSIVGFCTKECDPQDAMSCDGVPDGNVVCSWENGETDPRYVCGLCSDTPACDPGCPDGWLFLEAVGLCYPLAPPPFPDIYKPCLTDAECMSGLCVVENGASPDQGFCSILCSPAEEYACAHLPSPRGAGAFYCSYEYGISAQACGAGCPCPAGWTSNSDISGCTCFPPP